MSQQTFFIYIWIILITVLLVFYFLTINHINCMDPHFHNYCIQIIEKPSYYGLN